MSSRKFWSFILILLLILAACQSNEPEITATSAPEAESSAEAEPAEEAEPTARPTPTEAIIPEPEPAAEEETAPGAPTIIPPTIAPETAVTQPITEDITIEATDGLLLHATYYAPGGMAPFPGVILLHMLGSDRQVWAENGFAERLTTNGYAVLALDMRGHGDSGSSREWDKAEADLQRVWDYFASRETVNREKTAVIGASIGANIALRAGTNEPAINTVILLSPGLDYRGVTTEAAMAQYDQRPILIVASREDTYAAESSATLAGLAPGASQLQLYDGAGHGTNMFAPQPDLADLLLEWVNQYLRAE